MFVFSTLYELWRKAWLQPNALQYHNKIDFTDTKYASKARYPASPSAVIDETKGYDKNFQKPSAFPSQQRSRSQWVAQQDSTKQNVTALHSVQGTRCARVWECRASDQQNFLETALLLWNTLKWERQDFLQRSELDLTSSRFSY